MAQPGVRLSSISEGDKAIEVLRVGDVVWTKPEKGGQPFAAVVTATHVRTDQAIYRLRLKSIDGDLRDTLLVTDSHPFYVPARNDFIPLIDLRVGDQLQSLGDGASNRATISIESIDLVQPQGVTYNLSVNLGRTFYVGALRTWVHNEGPCDDPACKGGKCGVHSNPGKNEAGSDSDVPSTGKVTIAKNLPGSRLPLEKEIDIANVLARDTGAQIVLRGSNTPNGDATIKLADGTRLRAEFKTFEKPDGPISDYSDNRLKRIFERNISDGSYQVKGFPSAVALDARILKLSDDAVRSYVQRALSNVAARRPNLKHVFAITDSGVLQFPVGGM